MSKEDEGQVVQENSNEPSNFAMIPKMAMIDLDPYELTLYCHYKITASEGGTCYKSNKTLAAETGMSESKIKSVRAKLSEMEYISITPQRDASGQINMPPVVEVTNVWAKNRNRYTKKEAHPQVPKNHPPATKKPGVGTKKPRIKSPELNPLNKGDKPSRANLPQYPTNIKRWSYSHIDHYHSEHSNTLDALVELWYPNNAMLKHLKDVGKSTALQFIEAHKELVRLNICVDDYGKVVETTRTKFAWKKEGIPPSDICDAVTDYLQVKSIKSSASSTQEDAIKKAQLQHEYEEMFGAKR